MTRSLRAAARASGRLCLLTDVGVFVGLAVGACSTPAGTTKHPTVSPVAASTAHNACGLILRPTARGQPAFLPVSARP